MPRHHDAEVISIESRHAITTPNRHGRHKLENLLPITRSPARECRGRVKKKKPLCRLRLIFLQPFAYPRYARHLTPPSFTEPKLPELPIRHHEAASDLDGDTRRISSLHHGTVRSALEDRRGAIERGAMACADTIQCDLQELGLIKTCQRHRGSPTRERFERHTWVNFRPGVLKCTRSLTSSL